MIEKQSDLIRVARKVSKIFLQSMILKATKLTADFNITKLPIHSWFNYLIVGIICFTAFPLLTVIKCICTTNGLFVGVSYLQCVIIVLFNLELVG